MPDFTAAETEAAIDAAREYLKEYAVLFGHALSASFKNRKPSPTEIMLAEIDRLRAVRDELVAALDHDYLRRMMGTIEDSDTGLGNVLWRDAQRWFAIRDPLLAKHGADHG